MNESEKDEDLIKEKVNYCEEIEEGQRASPLEDYNMEQLDRKNSNKVLPVDNIE